MVCDRTRPWVPLTIRIGIRRQNLSRGGSPFGAASTEKACSDSGRVDHEDRTRPVCPLAGTT